MEVRRKNIELDIDLLVFDGGYENLDPQALGPAIESTLSRQTQPRLPELRATDHQVSNLTTQSQDADARTLGSRIAQIVAEVLT